MSTTPELESALTQSNAQLKTLTEVRDNKKTYDEKGDQLKGVVAPENQFSQPVTPYDPQYPYNDSKETESGHVIDFDDTPGAERIGITHRTGTFIEMHPDGSKTEKIMNDSVQIIMKDGYIYIMNNQQTSIQGNLKVYIKGNAKVQVDGDVELEVVGDMKMKVDGQFTAMAEKFNLIGPVDVAGDLRTTGNILTQGNISADKQIQSKGNFIGHADCICSDISLVHHTHTGIEPGLENTGEPQ